jgi:CBS domain-containing protein
MPPYLYLIERGGKLAGVVDPLDLLGAAPEMPLAGIMSPALEWLGVADARSRVLAHGGWRELRALPVVDEDHRLVGVVAREIVSRLQNEVGQGKHPVSLTLSLAELFWIGVAGMTEGFAKVTGGTREPTVGPGAPGPGAPTGGGPGAPR